MTVEVSRALCSVSFTEHDRLFENNLEPRKTSGISVKKFSHHSGEGNIG